MSIDLKPCPFCGGEAEFGGNYHTGFFVECLSCGTNDPLPNLNFSMDEVAAAWNTRAERTCRMDCVGYIGTEESHASIYQCSKCNRRYMSANVPDLGEYCSECGAKVVG